MCPIRVLCKISSWMMGMRRWLGTEVSPWDSYERGNSSNHEEHFWTIHTLSSFYTPQPQWTANPLSHSQFRSSGMYSSVWRDQIRTETSSNWTRDCSLFWSNESLNPIFCVDVLQQSQPGIFPGTGDINVDSVVPGPESIQSQSNVNVHEMIQRLQKFEDEQQKKKWLRNVRVVQVTPFPVMSLIERPRNRSRSLL